MPQNEVAIPVRVVDEFSRTLKSLERDLTKVMNNAITSVNSLSDSVDDLKDTLKNLGTELSNVGKTAKSFDPLGFAVNIMSMTVVTDRFLGILGAGSSKIKSLSDGIEFLSNKSLFGVKALRLLGTAVGTLGVGLVGLAAVDFATSLINQAAEVEMAIFKMRHSLDLQFTDIYQAWENFDKHQKAASVQRLEALIKEQEAALKNASQRQRKEAAKLNETWLSNINVWYDRLKSFHKGIEFPEMNLENLDEVALLLHKIGKETKDSNAISLANKIDKAVIAYQEASNVVYRFTRRQEESNRMLDEAKSALNSWDKAMQRAGVTAGTVASMEEILLTQAARLHAEIKVNGIKNISNFNDRMIDLAKSMKHWHMDLSKLPKDLQQFIRNAQEAAKKAKEAAGGFNMFHDALSINIGVALKLAGAFQIMKPFLEEHKRLLKEGEKVTLAFGTAQEKAAILMCTQVKPQLELLEKLHKRGIISTETFVKASTAEYDILIKQVFSNLKMGFIDRFKDKFFLTYHQSHQAYLKSRMVVGKSEEMMDRLNNAA